MTGIFQTRIPYDVTAPRPLPGIAPLEMADWLFVDDAFAEQMAMRKRLIEQSRDAVVAMTGDGGAAAAELLAFTLDWLAGHAPGYAVGPDRVRRPDGVTIAIDRDDPMGTLGHLVQEDLCLLQKRGEEHVLTAAVVCFPASWRLAEKIGRPLSGIHEPVAEYDTGVARRVQRLFDGVRVGRPLWRFNVLTYAAPDLFQPDPRPEPHAAEAGGEERFPYVRSERQCVLRLPETGACVFSIHSFVLAPGQTA